MLAGRSLVWFKRDLRVHDHAPLVAALDHAQALAIFMLEPEWLQSQECDASDVDLALARRAHCVIGMDYPAPIVDDRSAMTATKDRMYGLRKTQETREEAGAVQTRHGSRKSGLPTPGQRRKAKESLTPPPQGDLFA